MIRFLVVNCLARPVLFVVPVMVFAYGIGLDPSEWRIGVLCFASYCLVIVVDYLLPEEEMP
jgi:hypothetical protein